MQEWDACIIPESGHTSHTSHNSHTRRPFRVVAAFALRRWQLSDLLNERALASTNDLLHSQPDVSCQGVDGVLLL
eukprot:gene3598-6975_t